MSENNDKTIAILSYITILGWVIALIMNSDKKADEKSFNAFHLRQGLGLFIVTLLYSLINGVFTWIPYLGKLTHIVFVVVFIGIAVMGIINAVNGQRKYLLFFGKPTDTILGSTFN